MSLRVCLVSPFAWSQPHDVNEHVAGVAAGLRRLGHHVTVLAPSSRTADLLAGRRALLDGADAEVIALGPALPVSRRSRVGVPVGVRANLSLALAVGRYDVVHGFEPGLPSLSYLALRDAQALAVATFLSPERLGYPPGRSQRERLLGRARAPIFGEASIVVPALTGLQRMPLEAAAAGAAVAAPPAMREQPELAAAAFARLAEDDDYRGRTAAKNRAEAEKQSFDAVAAELDALYRRLAGRRRPRREADPLADREWILCDLHTHTSWSHDCRVEVGELLEHAELEGLGAIAVTDHNALGGALEALEPARGRDLVVVPGEEVKTAGQGEVIGLFLTEEIPRGLSFADTIAAIRSQGGLVYLPHPFDRLHAIPDAPTLHRHLADIDVFEVYNARLLFDAYNDEALRFATKYNLTMGAGSDAHVLQGLGTGVLRMRAFEGPAEFLISLRSAQVLRRPKSLVYLQSLKWVAQAKERVR